MQITLAFSKTVSHIEDLRLDQRLHLIDDDDSAIDPAQHDHPFPHSLDWHGMGNVLGMLFPK
jgi:hypothetical protein